MFVFPLIPNMDSRASIQNASKANMASCWTCGSCDFECPASINGSPLRPRTIVRLANYGLVNQLVDSQEIWHCLGCRRCIQVCPNLVKPMEVIAYARRLSMDTGKVGWDTFQKYQSLFSRFQRVRWRVVDLCLRNEFTESRIHWDDWLDAPITELDDAISVNHQRYDNFFTDAVQQARMWNCFTCGECSSACPVACQRSVFDPRSIFRMVHLGLMDELVHSPSIWLCLSCGRCSEVCSQLVDGKQIILTIRNIAMKNGHLNGDFHLRLEWANKLIYKRFFDQVDFIFGKE